MEAERQTIWFRDWVKLPDYATQKTDETGDADIARGLILRELQREAEGRLPYRYKRADDIDRRWHYEGLPIGYQWNDATIDWLRSTARWVKRLRPGLSDLDELEIYQIQVNPPLPRESEPEEIFPSLFKPGEPEPEPAVDNASPVETEAAETEAKPAANDAVSGTEAVPDTEVTDVTTTGTQAQIEKTKPTTYDESKNKTERIKAIIAELDRKRPCPFKAGMQPRDIERIIKPRYNELWLPESAHDGAGKYLGPSREHFWRVYKSYRATCPLPPK